MKFIFIVTLIVVIMVGGVIAQDMQKSNTPEVVTIDGCEYFRFVTYGFYYGLCHKGNCKACEAKHLTAEATND